MAAVFNFTPVLLWTLTAVNVVLLFVQMAKQHDTSGVYTYIRSSDAIRLTHYCESSVSLFGLEFGCFWFFRVDVDVDKP
jgi:putative exporter of polyketide antibiotics